LKIVITQANKPKWYVLNQGVKGLVKQVLLCTEKKYCCGLIHP